MQMRWIYAVAAGALFGAVVLPPVESLVAPAIAHAEDADEIETLAVGAELVAVTDVKLHQAEIGKGSKVSVVKLDKDAKDGHLTSVDVELADGHVVPHVRANMIRSAFRLASE